MYSYSFVVFYCTIRNKVSTPFQGADSQKKLSSVKRIGGSDANLSDAPILAHEMQVLKGQSHEKVGKMRVWGVSLGPN
jgi:hypothetical protein